MAVVHGSNVKLTYNGKRVSFAEELELAPIVPTDIVVIMTTEEYARVEEFEAYLNYVFQIISESLMVKAFLFGDYRVPPRDICPGNDGTDATVDDSPPSV